MRRRWWVPWAAGAGVVLLLAAWWFTARWIAEFDTFTRVRSIQVGMAEADVEAVMGKGTPFDLVQYRKGPGCRLVCWSLQDQGPLMLVVEFDRQDRVKQRVMLDGIFGPVVKEDADMTGRLRAWLGW